MRHLAVKLQADGARMRRHLVQDEARRRDDAVATFLLHAGQASQKLVCHVLAEPFLAKALSRYCQDLGFARHPSVAAKPRDAKMRQFGVVDLAEVVSDAFDQHPLGLGGHHFPRCEIVDRRAPQHGFLAAGIHGDIAADAGSIRGSRIHSKYAASSIRRFHDPASHDACCAMNGGHRLRQAGQQHRFHRTEGFQLLGVDHCGKLVERYRAAGITSAAAARDDGESEFDASLYERLHLSLGIGIEHHEGILDAPVGGVGHMRHPRQAVECNIVAPRYACQPAQDFTPQLRGFLEIALEFVHRFVRRGEQLRDFAGHVGGLFAFAAAQFDLVQAVAQRLDQSIAAPWIVQHVVLQVGIAVDDPDVAEHFIEHACRTSGATLAAQFVQHLPHRGAEQSNHDLAIGKRGVVVGDFAKPDAGGGEGRNRLHLIRTS